jgi:hypothetical protein
VNARLVGRRSAADTRTFPSLTWCVPRRSGAAQIGCADLMGAAQTGCADFLSAAQIGCADLTFSSLFL